MTLTSASEQLGMTQSAISHAVASLEKELQVSLLERDRAKRTLRERNGIFVTEIGKKVLIQAQTMLACAETIRLFSICSYIFDRHKQCV
ncbi:MAG: LysR family transcriptional regulator [Hydrococcus sp. Prado102]|jgi:DNA-binding transcriptional LysR family regulator|nr:LysR family transcriptional regulator [Hydrococcus sp. Prado102]